MYFVYININGLILVNNKNDFDIILNPKIRLLINQNVFLIFQYVMNCLIYRCFDQICIPNTENLYSEKPIIVMSF
jgi:hypothetical protein